MTDRENYRLGAEPVELGSHRPGDSEAQAQARDYLRRLMREYPKGVPGRTKDDFRGKCKHMFKTPKRVFDRVWKEEIATSGATAWEKKGPKRGPRGPHRARKN
jgi:hypothetical protein